MKHSRAIEDRSDRCHAPRAGCATKSRRRGMSGPCEYRIVSRRAIIVANGVGQKDEVGRSGFCHGGAGDQARVCVYVVVLFMRKGEAAKKPTKAASVRVSLGQQHCTVMDVVIDTEAVLHTTMSRHEGIQTTWHSADQVRSPLESGCRFDLLAGWPQLPLMEMGDVGVRVKFRVSRGRVEGELGLGPSRTCHPALCDGDARAASSEGLMGADTPWISVVYYVHGKILHSA